MLLKTGCFEACECGQGSLWERESLRAAYSGQVQLLGFSTRGRIDPKHKEGTEEGSPENSESLPGKLTSHAQGASRWALEGHSGLVMSLW